MPHHFTRYAVQRPKLCCLKCDVAGDLEKSAGHTSAIKRRYLPGGLFGGWHDPHGLLAVTMSGRASAGPDEKVKARVATRIAAAILAQPIRLAPFNILFPSLDGMVGG